MSLSKPDRPSVFSPLEDKFLMEAVEMLMKCNSIQDEIRGNATDSDIREKKNGAWKIIDGEMVFVTPTGIQRVFKSLRNIWEIVKQRLSVRKQVQNSVDDTNNITLEQYMKMTYRPNMYENNKLDDMITVENINVDAILQMPRTQSIWKKWTSATLRLPIFGSLKTGKTKNKFESSGGIDEEQCVVQKRGNGNDDDKFDEVYERQMELLWLEKEIKTMRFEPDTSGHCEFRLQAFKLELGIKQFELWNLQKSQEEGQPPVPYELTSI